MLMSQCKMFLHVCVFVCLCVCVFVCLCVCVWSPLSRSDIIPLQLPLFEHNGNMW